jgi:hypothetical protein
VELSHEVRPRRAAAVAAGAFAALLLARWLVSLALAGLYSSGWLVWPGGDGRVTVAAQGVYGKTNGFDVMPLTNSDGWEAVAIVVVLCSIPWAMVLLGLVISGSLREAKVRQRHVIRAAIYGVSMVPLLIFAVSTVGLGAIALQNMWTTKVLPPVFEMVVPGLQFVWVFLWPLIMLVWWWAAYRYYMHLRRSLVGAVLMMTAVVIATPIVILLVTMLWAFLTGR